MAKKRNVRNTLIGTILFAAVLGGVIGAIIFNDPGDPLPAPAKVDFTEPYDDSWGRLSAPVARCGVTHILVKIDDSRSEEEARKQIEQIWHQYKNNPTKENWHELQDKHNEDTADKFAVFPIPGNLVPEFQETGKTTEIGFARICKSTYGFHLIRRES